jgi:ubiquinone/menaquinone biosynthesis C-methylase UbiE
MNLRERWTVQADLWAAWAQNGHEDDVLPQFYDLLPKQRGRTLDVGCGEGRMSRALRARGYDVVGIDVAPRLVELARERDPEGQYRLAPAEELPFDDRSFDLLVAYNVLMNVDDPATAVRESARVLRTGGRFCISLVHPLASAGVWESGRFLISDYLTERPHEEHVGELVFANVHRPLEQWSKLLENAGLLIEALREVPRAAVPRWRRLPMFLYLRTVKS